MTIRTRKPTPSYKDYSRKPYMEGDENDYREMMTAVPNKAMINQRYEPQSEFLKPYLSDVPYSEMEHFYPPPFTNFAWPNWKFPEFSGPVPEDGEWEGDAGGEFGDRDTPRNPCSFELRQKYCTQMKELDLPVTLAGASGSKLPSDKYPYSARSHFWSFEGVGKHCITNIRVRPPGIRTNPFLYYSYQYLAHYIFFNWTQDCACAEGNPSGYVGTKLCYNIRGVCKHCIDVHDTNCCEECCPAETTFEFDDANTADTMTAVDGGDPGHTVIYVLGGCGDFTFSTTSKGYYFNAGLSEQSITTSDRFATLYCDGVGNT